MLNKTTRILGIIVLILGFLVLSSKGILAQNVQLKGKTFVVIDSAKDQPTDTGYEYIDKNNVSHPVYISKTGKAYIICKSKKTGKEYRRYLPKVTEMLNSIKKCDRL